MSKVKDKLFELFAGEYVSILIDMQIESVNQKNDTVEMTKMPLSVTGFLIEEDDKHYYLGPELNVCNQAVKKEYIIHIEVIEESSETEDTLKNVNGPDGKKFN